VHVSVSGEEGTVLAHSSVGCQACYASPSATHNLEDRQLVRDIRIEKEGNGGHTSVYLLNRSSR
jgi:hypothetical protein